MLMLTAFPIFYPNLGLSLSPSCREEQEELGLPVEKWMKYLSLLSSWPMALRNPVPLQHLGHRHNILIC